MKIASLLIGASLAASLTEVANAQMPIEPEELVAPKVELSAGTVSFTVEPSVSGRRYQLQGSVAMDARSWQNLGPERTGDGNPLVISTPYNSTISQRFFRLALDAWQTVDLFQDAPGLSGVATDIGTAADGATLYSVGYADTSSTGAIVRKSSDSGQTWTTVDKYLKPGWIWAGYRGFGSGADGSLFACGGQGDGTTKSWFVRQSADDGATWVTVDEFLPVPDAWATCSDVKMNPYTGDVYAVGTGNSGGGNSTPFNWIVRKRAAGAANFETVDTVSALPYGEAWAVAFHPTMGVLVAGSLGDGTTHRWTVRRSATGHRGTWSTVDAFQESQGAFSTVRGIAVGPAPSYAIYVSGKAIQKLRRGPVRTVNNWVVRRSLNGGSAWTTVDQFGADRAFLSGGGWAKATGITLSPSGKVFVTVQSPGYPSGHMVRIGTTDANDTMTWVTSDDFQLEPGQHTEGTAITSDAFGNLFSTALGEVDNDHFSYYLTRRLPGPQ